MMLSRPHALALAACLLPFVASCSPKTPKGRAQRVILVTCDTLRADRLGCYGYGVPTSPHVDAFARDAVVFDDAWSTAPWTGPSLSALMTGRLPDELGVPGGNRFPLPAAARTLAEIARDAGLPTGAVVSNWILRRPPSTFGDAGVAQGFAHFDDQMRVRERNRESYERVAPDTTDAAIHWLAERQTAGEERFFAWFHYQDPHGPYEPPPPYAARVARPSPRDEAPLRVSTNVKGKGAIPTYQVVGDERVPEQYRTRYDGEIAYFDEHFGRLVEWLKSAGWYDDALIVFSSDHGESLGESDYWFCHGENVRPEVVRVPFVVRFPKGAPHVKADSIDGYARVRSIAGHLDVWPTVLEALGLEGRSNRGSSLFASALPQNRIVTQTMGRLAAKNRWVAYGDERWRVVLEGSLAPRLFDRVRDPFDEHDVAAQNPGVVADLERRHREFLASNAAPALDAKAIEGNADVDKGMHSLGYTGDDH